MWITSRQQETKSPNKSENSSLVFNSRIYEVLGKTLGKGTFGKVKLGTHQITKEKAAIKILDKSMIKDASDLERVNREISILKKLRHPHVVQLFDVRPSAPF